MGPMTFAILMQVVRRNHSKKNIGKVFLFKGGCEG
jgi:hypothetical protein